MNKDKNFSLLNNFDKSGFSAKRYLAGFTLIELMVSVVLFTTVMIVVSTIFVSSLKSQRRILFTQELLDQSSYLIEYMGRSIRMSKKDVIGDCLTSMPVKSNYETDNMSRDRIRFLSYDDKCQEFFWENGQIKQRKSTDNTAGNFGIALPLTSDSLDVLSFNVGSSQSWLQPVGDYYQARVTLFLEIQGGDKDQASLKLQTTISKRNLDVQI